MPGVAKHHKTRRSRHPFPASRYNDPRGGRASSLERNVLRYRSVETVLFLHFAEEVREFMIANVLPHAAELAAGKDWAPEKTQRIARLLYKVVGGAERANEISNEEAAELRALLEANGRQSKPLIAAFKHAIAIGMLSEAEANEIQRLIDYRNDLAHRMHLVMADMSRCRHVGGYLEWSGIGYKTDALDRLRRYRRELWDRLPNHMIYSVSFDGVLFEFAERVFEDELKRLERLIERQIKNENTTIAKLRAELDLRGTELKDDLTPRFPLNFRPAPRSYKDEYIPPTGHLTPRGVEICFRLYDLGKSPLAVAWAMGISLAAAKNRQRGWLAAGGSDRTLVELERFDMRTGRKVTAAA